MKTLAAELVINAASRRGRTLYKEVVAACERHGITLEKTHLLTKDTTLEAILSDVVARQPKLVIVGGGDGTISDAVDHLVDSPIELGILPLGTTNNFARSLELPLEIDDCVRRIKTAAARPVDLGKIGHEYFANVAGIGLSGDVAETVTDGLKKRLGRLAYAWTGLRLLLTHKPFYVTVKDAHEDLEVTFETHQVIVANGRYHAGKKIALEARVDNRELIIFALGGRSKLSLLYRLLDFYLGQRRSVRHSSYLIGRHFTLETDRPQRVELDGEVKFETPITIEVAPKVVQVRY